MDFLNAHLLTLILFAPTAVALLVLLLPARQVGVIRWVAFIGSLAPLGLSVFLWFGYRPAEPGFQFQEFVPWYQAIGANYHLGVDGISVPMVLLTTLLTSLAILISFSIRERVRAYMVLFLLLETGLLGVFLSLDLLLFFVFWEAGLVPMYFLINQWGSENRNYASLKFLIYTMGGSLGLLLAIQMIRLVVGSFDLPVLYSQWNLLKGTLFGVPVGTVKILAFWAFVIAFAIKVPIWPFHTWLPDAHAEAPTGGSIILAGVMLKLGAYGFLRLLLPLYPAEAHDFAGVLGGLAVAGIVLGAFASWGQKDFKRLVAYSSVNHMGFVVLGIAAAAWARGSASSGDAVLALNGAVLQMFNHGLSAAGMFLLVGVLYERTHTRQLDDYGGLFALAPLYGGILIFTSMGSLGLPGLGGFISEFLVVRGSWPIFTLYTAIAMVGLLITGAYILKAVQKVLHGPVNPQWQGHSLEIGVREALAISPLMILMLAIGVWPAWILNMINAAVMHLFG
ncbi:MAG: NADH-quinone oxidoreductase subunit M [Anaerolineales bacterium]|jgi:NADH-quinone oxidoreductase subunit M